MAVVAAAAPAQGRAPRPGRGGPASVMALQRAAGNAAVARALAGRDAAPAALLRQPAPAPPAPGPAVATQGQVKHTLTLPDRKLGGQKDLGYAAAQFMVGGTVDLEVTPPQADPGTPTSGVTLKGAGGVNATEGDGRYQAEVTAEFEKRVGGVLDGCTPKAKVGGEAGADGAKLGLEFSLEGETFEPKFGITIVDLSKEDGLTFLTLEAGVDWKIREFPFTASDGAAIKVTPKATVKVAITPNYTRIAAQLAEGGRRGGGVGGDRGGAGRRAAAAGGRPHRPGHLHGRREGRAAPRDPGGRGRRAAGRDELRAGDDRLGAGPRGGAGP